MFVSVFELIQDPYLDLTHGIGTVGWFCDQFQTQIIFWLISVSGQLLYVAGTGRSKSEYMKSI